MSFRIEPFRQQESKEQDPIVPIIDIVRHGPTVYKELKDPSFVFDPTAEGFKLDVEHLDLTEEGIEIIRNTGKQLAAKIDKKNEVVLILTSPNFRAQSTDLLIDEELRAAGVSMLLPREENLRIVNNLRQINFKDQGDRADWIVADGAFRAEAQLHTKLPPEQAHEKIAAALGRELSDIFTEDYQDIDARLKRFIRHATNINRYLDAATKARLEGKRLRIIAVTHEEVPSRLMGEVLSTRENIKKGQVLEIRARQQLKTGASTTAEFELLPHGDEGEYGKNILTLSIDEE